MAGEGQFPKVDGDVLYASDTNLMRGLSSGVAAAQLTYQILQVNNIFVNRDNLGTDEFLDVNGTNNTVDTTTTTAFYKTASKTYTLDYTDEASGDTNHDPDSFTNPGYAFDANDATYADKSVNLGTDADISKYLGKTFASKFVGLVKIKASNTRTAAGYVYLYLETYDGTNWNNVAELSGGYTSTYDSIYVLDATVQGIRIRFRGTTAASADARTLKLYTLEYGDYNATDTVETNEVVDCGTAPNSLVVYAHKSLPTGTSITIDISQNGGTSFEITNKELDTYIDTSSFTGHSIAIKFNLATTDTSHTPLIYGYGIVITSY